MARRRPSRDDAGRTRPAVQAHLAEVFAGAVDAVGDLAAARRRCCSRAASRTGSGRGCRRGRSPRSARALAIAAGVPRAPAAQRFAQRGIRSIGSALGMAAPSAPLAADPVHACSAHVSRKRRARAAGKAAPRSGRPSANGCHAAHRSAAAAPPPAHQCRRCCRQPVFARMRPIWVRTVDTPTRGRAAISVPASRRRSAPSSTRLSAGVRPGRARTPPPTAARRPGALPSTICVTPRAAAPGSAHRHHRHPVPRPPSPKRHQPAQPATPRAEQRLAQRHHVPDDARAAARRRAAHCSGCRASSASRAAWLRYITRAIARPTNNMP